MAYRTALIALGAFALAGGGAGYVFLQTQPELAVVEVGRGTAVRVVYATGIVEPVSWSRVAPTNSGRLVAIFKRDGEPVRVGEPLARLDEREARARLAELEARERYWREESQRQAQLQDRGFATRESRDRSASELGQAQAAVVAQRRRIEDLTLTAPMDGIVLRQDGEVGEVVDNRQTLFWIGRSTPLRVTADIDEEDIPEVARGQRVLVKADAFPGRALEASVAEITPKGDPVAKSFRARLALPPDTPLKIGMTVEVNVIVREVAGALLIPATALRAGPKGREALVVRDGRLEARAVRVGVEGAQTAEIVEGLAEGERVVRAPAGSLRDGARVRIAGEAR